MTKTFDKKDVFSVLNAEDASRYVGEKGYFADDLQTLKQNVEENRLYKLHKISANYTFPFRGEKEYDLNNFSLFLPADKVKEEEKKWRPFKTIDEFLKATNYPDLGDSLVLRSKSDPLIEIYVGYNGYSERNGELQELLGINFGSGFINPHSLLNLYEFFNCEDEWQPFGVLEE